MKTEASKIRSVFKSGEGQFVSADDNKTRQRKVQCVSVKDRNTQQSQGEQDEIEGNSEEENWVGQCGLGGSRRIAKISCQQFYKSTGEAETNGRAAKSALGQKRTCAVHNGMSALPPKADTRHFRPWPLHYC